LYGLRSAAYDLKKFRAKKLLSKIEGTHRYTATPTDLRALTALVVLRDKVIKPLLAAACYLKTGRKPNTLDIPRSAPQKPAPKDARPLSRTGCSTMNITTNLFAIFARKRVKQPR
jgi:hypothetical protein